MESRNDMQLSQIWGLVLEIMRGKYQGPSHAFQLWFGRMEFRYLDAERAMFVCENETKRQIISTKYIDFIGEALEEVIGYFPEITIDVDTSLAPIVPNDGSSYYPMNIVNENKRKHELEAKKAQERDLYFDEDDDADYDEDEYEDEDEEPAWASDFEDEAPTMVVGDDDDLPTMVEGADA